MKPKNKSTFQWSRDNSKQIFPIDYSLKEFLDKSKLITSPQTIKKNVLNHPVLQQQLQDMLVTNPQKNQIPEKSGTPIPFEADLFLTIFYQLDLQPDEKNVSVDQFEKFCRLLREKVDLSIGNDSHNIFYRHILFQNAEFCKITLKDLWEGELTTRFQKLKELASRTAFDKQISVFVDCLQSLDRCMLNLELQDSDKPPTVKNPTLSTQEILEQLLSGRKKKRSSNIHAQYLVNNSKLSNGIYMEEAFKRLSQRKGSASEREKLLEDARQAYLKNLVDETE